MGDVFTELIIEKKPNPVHAILKIVLIAVTALAALAGLFYSPAFLLVFLAFCAVDYFLFPRFNVEYEYSYVNGDIDISAVYSKSSRKALGQVSAGSAECIAPANSHFLDSYGNTYRVVDYSAGDPENPPYVFVMGGSDKRKVSLQLDDTMLNDLKSRYPMKTHTD
jgi:hypothetical protein